MCVGGQRHAPAASLPGKTPFPLHMKLGGPQGQSGRARKISPPTEIRFPYRPARSDSMTHRIIKCRRNWGRMEFGLVGLLASKQLRLQTDICVQGFVVHLSLQETRSVFKNIANE